MHAPHRRLFDVWSLFYDLSAVQRATYHPVHDAVLKALGGRSLIALVNPRFALLSEVTAFGSRLLGEPFYWPTSARFRRTLRSVGFRTLSQRSVGRLPGAVLFPGVLSVAQKPG
jgi:hypothetical protein